MKPVEYHKNKLKELQDEMHSLNKRKKLIETLIKDKVKIIDDLIEPKIKTLHQNFDLIARDRDLCIDFIIKNKRVTSRQIIDFLNQELEGQSTRWKKELDGNLFMGIMGNHLLQLSNVRKEVDPNNNKKYYWEII